VLMSNLTLIRRKTKTIENVLHVILTVY
jgi:hypothetical protein